MKKFILTIVMAITTLAFTGCGNDDDGPTCRTCTEDNISVQACENGDGTISVTASVSGQEVFSDTIELDEGESIEDFDCEDFDLSVFDLTGFLEGGEVTTPAVTPTTGGGQSFTCESTGVTFTDNGDGTATATVLGISQVVSFSTVGTDNFETFVNISCSQG